jgi:vesicle-fusing ATPase
MSIRITLKADKSPDASAARTNLVYISSSNLSRIPSQEKLVTIKGFLFYCDTHPKVTGDSACFSQPQRKLLQISLSAPVDLIPINAGDLAVATEATIELNFSTLSKARKLTLDADALRTAWKQANCRIPLNLGSELQFVFENENYSASVVDLKAEKIDRDGERHSVEKPQSAIFGMNITHILFRKSSGSLLTVEDNSSTATTNVFFTPDFNLAALEIGGLDQEFATVFRRAFNTRLYPPKVIRERGIKHTKGILLCGPPGTGKTLMARQIGKMLNTVPPIIVNGPEVLNKFVGGSEEKIRALFEAARKDQDENGDNAQLHLIIFDEIDSICKKRGTVQGAAGVADTVVNQLLSMIDGVDALNDVLLIGMTNRRDLIDDAMTRPGRLEVIIEIPLPDEPGRRQIFAIHTRKLQESGNLGPDVDLDELASLTPNYTGAEIEGVVKAANEWALGKGVDAATGTARLDADLRVMRAHFLAGLQETRPAFGVEEKVLENLAPRGICDYSEDFVGKRRNLVRLIEALQHGEHASLSTFLIHGLPGTGLTTFAVKLATEGFGYVKAITAKQFIGRNEDAVCQEIRDIFENAYRSPESAVVIDDIESIIEFSPHGPRFANKILQSILVLLRCLPQKGHKLAVFVTTASRDAMKVIGVTSRYFSQEVQLMPLAKLAEVEIVAKEMSQATLDFGEEERARAERFFGGEQKNELPIKRALEAIDLAVFEAKGQRIEWVKLRENFVNQIARDRADVTY